MKTNLDRSHKLKTKFLTKWKYYFDFVYIRFDLLEFVLELIAITPIEVEWEFYLLRISLSRRFSEIDIVIFGLRMQYIFGIFEIAFLPFDKTLLIISRNGYKNNKHTEKNLP